MPRPADSWRGLEDVEFATLEWVAWCNTSRLLEPLGYLPAAEDEAQYHEAQITPAVAGALTWTRPLRTRGGSVAGNPGALYSGVEHVDGR
jgi:hypothetical protein